MRVERFTEGEGPCLWTVTPEQQAHEWYPGDERTRPDKRRVRGLGKPHGSWISVPGDSSHDWRAAAYSMGLPLGNYVHTFDLDVSRVLVIERLTRLDDFHRRYCADPRTISERVRDHRPRARVEPNEAAVEDAMACFRIDWPAIAERWAGIVIAPYQPARRTEFLWYYGWDCASGCIWDPSALTLLGTQRIGE